MARRHKEKKSKNPSQLTASPLITPENTAKIQALKRQISKHVTEINRPYAMVASMAFFPPFLQLLLLNERSPFHSMYMSYYGSTYRTIEIDTHELDQNIDSLNQRLAQTHQQYSHVLDDIMDPLFEKIKPILAYLTKKEDLTSRDVLEYLDNNADTVGEDVINNIRESLFDGLSPIINMLNENGRDLAIDPEGMAKTKLVDLYDALTKTFQLLKSLDQVTSELPKVVDRFTEKATKKILQEVVNMDFTKPTIILPKLVFMMFGQWCIINPILRKLFPQGIVFGHVPTASIPRNIYTINDKSAQNLIVDLEEKESYLRETAQRNIKLSRYITPIIFGLCLIYQDTEASPYLFFLLISALASAATGAVDDLRKLNKQRNYQARIKSIDKLYHAVFSDEYIQDLILIEDSGNQKDIETSQFDIRFNPIRRDEKIGISTSLVCRNVVNVLLTHNVSITQIYNNRILVPASQSTSVLNKAQQIKADIKAALDRQLSINELKHQLKTLTDARYPFIKISSESKLEQAALTTLVVNITIPKDILHLITSTLSNLKLQTVEKDDQTVSVSFESYNALSNEHFDKLVAGLNHYHLQHSRRLQEDGFKAIVVQPVPTPYKPTSSKQDSPKLPKQPESKPKESKLKLKWSFGSYDPSSDSNKVTPVLNGHNHHFVFFNITAEECSKELLRKVKPIVEAPKFVPRTSKQGLKSRTDTLVKDDKGNIVTASYEIKIKDKQFGTTRFFAFPEKVEKTGEVAHVFLAKNIRVTH